MRVQLGNHLLPSVNDLEIEEAVIEVPAPSDGHVLFDAVVERGLEGIVAKRRAGT